MTIIQAPTRTDFGCAECGPLSRAEVYELWWDMADRARNGPWVVETRHVVLPWGPLPEAPPDEPTEYTVWWPLSTERPTDADVIAMAYQGFDPEEDL